MVRVGQILWESLKFSYMHLTEIIILSLLWFFFSIPIITMPASICGIFCAINDLKDEKKVARDFLKGFRLYFSKTLPLGLVLLFLILVLVSSLWYYVNVRSTYSLIFTMFQSTIVIFILFTQIYTLPLMVNQNLNLINSVKISAILILSDIFFSLSVFLELIFISILLTFSIVGLPLLFGIMCIFINYCLMDLIEKLKLNE
ncbi:MAG: hypothetical protein N2380_07760 [bacterium]|nr:hypothetical protein [bacterium]